MSNSTAYDTFRAANAKLAELTYSVADKLGIVDVSSPAAVAEVANATDRAAIIAALAAADVAARAARAARSARSSVRLTT